MKLSVLELAAVSVAVAAVSAALPAQAPLAGTWDGYWTRAGDTMRVTMVIRADSAGYSGTFGAERLRVRGIPFNRVQMAGDVVSITLRGDRTTAVFSGTLRGDSLAGTIQEETGDGRFAFGRSRVTAPPFAEKEVSFRNGDVTLAGTLLSPAGADRFPTVVFLHGSGAEGRWASRFLAEQLASRGIGALIFDKRGVGQSTGDWRTALPEDLVRDGVAAAERLAQEPGVDARRIGIHGHSQGGTLAPMVAATSRRVAFVVASAGAGMPNDSVELYSVLNSIQPRARSAQDSADVLAYTSELVAVAYRSRPRARLDSLVEAHRGKPWFFAPPDTGNSYWRFSKAYGQYDPLAWWSRVSVPVLLVYGARDERVPAQESAARIAAVLKRAGNNAVTVRIFPDADHTFRLPPRASGWPATSPDYVPTLIGWLARR